MLLKRIIEECNIYEGLEITHNIDKAIEMLTSWMRLGDRIIYGKIDTRLKVTIIAPISKKEFDNLLKWTNNLGYFPASITTVFDYYKYDYDKVVDSLQDIEYDNRITISFDPKYDPEISEEDLPDKGYHITPSKNEEKIKKIGLSPRSKEKISRHPERIYFVTDIDDLIPLADSPEFSPGGQHDGNYTIFEFDLKELRKHRKIRFFSDPRYINKGYYTYENIPPKYLTVVKRVAV
jgi:hypothetical protein